MIKKILIIALILLASINFAYAHGVDVTADTMVIADESNGLTVKEIADANNLNISVYKFTSDDEVNHQLEHMLNNSNKRILVTSYQDVANAFLEKHPEVSNRLIVLSDVNNDTIKDGLVKIDNVDVGTEGGSDFMTPLISGLIIGLIIGVGVGVYIKYKK